MQTMQLSAYCLYSLKLDYTNYIVDCVDIFEKGGLNMILHDFKTTAYNYWIYMTLHTFTWQVIYCGDIVASHHVCHSYKPICLAIKNTMLRALLGKLSNNECGRCLGFTQF